MGIEWKDGDINAQRSQCLQECFKYWHPEKGRCVEGTPGSRVLSFEPFRLCKVKRRGKENGEAPRRDPVHWCAHHPDNWVISFWNQLKFWLVSFVNLLTPVKGCHVKFQKFLQATSEFTSHPLKLSRNKAPMALCVCARAYVEGESANSWWLLYKSESRKAMQRQKAEASRKPDEKNG